MDEEDIPRLEGVPFAGIVGAENTFVPFSVDSFFENGLITRFVIPIGPCHIKANAPGFVQ